jgi:predicted nucleic acid-binding protein
LKSVLIDSDVLIEVSRARNQEVLERWYKLIDSVTVPLCSPVSIAELWHGARQQEESVLKALFTALTCIPIEVEIGERAGEYLRQYEKSHIVELGDALIAATAVIHKAELWTRNRKHFPMKDIAFY